MKHQILQRPDASMLEIVFEQAGEKIVAEAGAMVGRDTNLEMTTSMRGGLGAALKRKMLGGESLFQNTFTASAPGERLQIAPPTEGDIMHVAITPDMGPFFIQSSGYLASTDGVELDTKWGGAKGFFSGAGMFLIKATGTGDLWISSFGAIHEIPIGGGTANDAGYIVDTGHILAFESGTNYSVRKLGGLKSLLASGEGIVAEFSGSGSVYLNTRNAGALAAFLYAYRPRKSN